MFCPIPSEGLDMCHEHARHVEGLDNMVLLAMFMLTQR
jgi:hypothetical protein